MEHDDFQEAPATDQRRRSADVRYLVRAILFILLLAGLAFLFRGPLGAAFFANPFLNGTILGLLGFGALYTLRALAETLRESRSIRRAGYQIDKTRSGLQGREEVSERILEQAPAALAPFLAKVQRVVARGDAAATLPYLLDSVATRADDRRALVRFLTGALVLLGLIGTFYGLLETLGGVRSVLGSLSADPEADTLTLLSQLQERLSLPLGGMGIAFSSSLFGLLASLVLAFLELQLFHAQNDVHADLESLVVGDLVPFWRGSERAGPATGAVDGATVVPGYVAALLETTAERIERMSATMERIANREAETDRVGDKAAALGEHIDALRSTLERLERERTETLRDELRLLTRTLARERSEYETQD